MLPRLSQFPADPRLSPYTGWTRAHWEATAATELRNHAEHLARHLVERS